MISSRGEAPCTIPEACNAEMRVDNDGVGRRHGSSSLESPTAAPTTTAADEV